MIAYNSRARFLLLAVAALLVAFGVYCVSAKGKLLYGGLAWPVFGIALLLALPPVCLWLRHQKLWKTLITPRKFSHSAEEIPHKDSHTYLGRGYLWTPEHARRLAELSVTGLSLPESSRDELAGDWLIHGVGGDSYQDLYLPNSLLSQHVFLLGGTGTGKSRGLEVLIEQAVKRGDAVVVIDPKGDERLLDRTYDCAHAAGRGDAFRFFALPFPKQSTRYNPLRNRVRVSEITDRIAMVLPKSGGDAEAFKNFAWMFVNIVVTALELIGEKITIAHLENYCLHNTWGLVRKVIHHFFPTIDASRSDIGLVCADYQKHGVQKGKGVLELDQLIGMAQMEQKYFEKISSALRPLFAKLLTGGVGYLLCPGEIDSIAPGPRSQSTPPSDPPEEISWDQIDEKRQVVYFFLGAMIGPDTASGVAKMALADLQAYIGRKYAYDSQGNYGRITVIIDECGDVLSDSTVNLLNKARGANLGLILAGQSLADLDVALGSPAAAQRVLGNLGTYINLRSDNPDDAEFFSRKCGEHPQLVTSEGDAYEPALWNSARQNIDDFAYRHSRTTSLRAESLVPPALIGRLPRFHYMARHSGAVFQGVFPLLDPPRTLFSPSLKAGTA